MHAAQAGWVLSSTLWIAVALSCWTNDFTDNFWIAALWLLSLPAFLASLPTPSLTQGYWLWLLRLWRKQSKDQHGPLSTLFRLAFSKRLIKLTTSSVSFRDTKAPPLFCFSSHCPSHRSITLFPSPSRKNVDILQLSCFSPILSSLYPHPLTFGFVHFQSFLLNFFAGISKSVSSFLISFPNSTSIFLTLKSCFPFGCPMWHKVTQKAA